MSPQRLKNSNLACVRCVVEVNLRGWQFTLLRFIDYAFRERVIETIKMRFS